MCGIAGYHRRNDAAVPNLDRLAGALLRGIESRGRDATGAMGLNDDGSTWLRKDVVPAYAFVPKSGALLVGESRTVLLHTRWATVGRADDPRNAHPVESGTFAAVHNGTITNATEIFDAFGLPRAAEVDSEVIPALAAHAGWDQIEAALGLLEGGAAIAMVDAEHPRDLILARTRSYPLVYAITDDLVVWASTETAVRRAFRDAFGGDLRASAISEMPQMHIGRVNGEVKVARFAPDPPAYDWAPKSKGYSPKKSKRRGVNTAPSVVASKGQKRRAKRAGRQALQPADFSFLTDVELDDDDSLATDIAIDILVAEGYSLEEAMEVVRDEVYAANEWRRDWDDDWEWEGDALVYRDGLEPARPAWHAHVYGGQRLRDERAARNGVL